MQLLDLNSIESIGYVNSAYRPTPFPFRMEKIKQCYFEDGLFVIINKRGKKADYLGSRIIIVEKAKSTVC